MPDDNNAVDFSPIKLGVKLKYPENLESKFATNVVIQQQQDFFTISFFEAFLPPVIVEDPKELKRVLETMNAVDGTCVSRIILTPSKMMEFADALNKNIEVYKKNLSHILNKGQ